MIVRVLNKKRDRDSLYDCQNSCLRKTDLPEGVKEYSLILEFIPEGQIEVILVSGDEVYYMNDSGNTVHADYIMRDK